MIWLILFSVILISLVSLFVTALPAHAALPPLGDEERNRESKYIVIGNVKTVSPSEVSIDEGTNYQYIAVVEVIAVEKGLLMSSDPTAVVVQPLGTPTPGDRIEVNYWQAGNRPVGWSGVGGQYSGLQPETRVRLFLREDDEGCLHLVDPNGWEAISQD